jgi:hypothetical protein
MIPAPLFLFLQTLKAFVSSVQFGNSLLPVNQAMPGSRYVYPSRIPSKAECYINDMVHVQRLVDFSSPFKEDNSELSNYWEIIKRGLR